MSNYLMNLKVLYHALGDIKESLLSKNIEADDSLRFDEVAGKIDQIQSGGSDELAKELIEGSTTNVVIPDGVTKIRNYFFEGWTTLKSITIPDGVKSIGDYALAQCSSLTSITIPDSVTYIGVSTFQNCLGLTSITLPNSGLSLAGSSFNGCRKLTSITIPENIGYVGQNVFYGCSSLASVYIPSKMTNIPISTFTDCTSLNSVTLSEGVSKLNSGAFRGCTSLVTITLPNSITFIDTYVFQGCSNLTSVTYRGITYTNYHKLMQAFTDNGVDCSSRAFSNTGLDFTEPSDEVAETKWYKGDLLEKEQLITQYTAADNVEEVSKVVLGSAVTSIASKAFEWSAPLYTLIMSDSVTQVSDDAFLTDETVDEEDYNLVINYIKVSSSLNSLGTMFRNWHPQVLNFGNSRTTICEATSDSFGGSYPSAIIVPDALYDEWSTASGWSNRGKFSKMYAYSSQEAQNLINNVEGEV